MFHSGHRHYHCVHPQITTNNEDMLRHVKTGFKGHNNDAVTFRQLPRIGLNKELDFLAETCSGRQNISISLSVGHTFFCCSNIKEVNNREIHVPMSTHKNNV